MSFTALAWAAEQRPGNLAAKMVLLALANFANKNGCAYPSIGTIAAFGEMDERTVAAGLDRLLSLGLIADTGDRQGRTRQIKIYRVAPDRELEAPQNCGASDSERPTFLQLKDPQKCGEDPQKWGTEPIRNLEDKPSLASTRIDIPDWVPSEAWDGWIEMRKQIRKPPSPHAIRLAVAELEKLRAAGNDPGAVLNQSTINSWRGLFPLRAPASQNNAQSPNEALFAQAGRLRPVSVGWGPRGDA